ncbi:hypothetical protein [Aeromonas veronii]|uniref:hypothetical protein n=1 Tax=Aeromonas veronii TaxID=654 RepID=UPI0011C04F0E|nr:hypothetical protein [Aeromonas veronii]
MPLPRTDNSAPDYRLSQMLALLALIEDGHGGAPAKDLSRLVGITRSSFKRYLVRAETELRVVVEWEKGLGYLVSSWGLLSKGELMAHYHGGGFASVIKS